MKGIFSKTTCVCTYVPNSKLILTSVRQDGGRREWWLIVPPSPPQNRSLESPPRLGLKILSCQILNELFMWHESIFC